MKLLEQSSNRINTDLDHVSFDQKKAMLMQQNQTNDSLDVFYDEGKCNMQLNMPNMDYPENGLTDENNNNYNQENGYNR